MTHWLSGEDLTTPANDRVRERDRPPDGRARRDGRGPSDALVFLAGVWAVIGAVPVAYHATGRFEVLWNDVVVGIAVAVVTLLRLVGPAAGTGPLAGVTCALGGWLVAAPFVLGYGGGPDDGRALVNDVAVGLAIMAFTATGAALSRVDRRAPSDAEAAPRSVVVGEVP
jgi:hypothetical protein